MDGASSIIAVQDALRALWKRCTRPSHREITMYGYCARCGMWKDLTDHHLIGVRDTHRLNPDLDLYQVQRFEAKLRRHGTQSPQIKVCRQCHDILEYQKKLEDRNAKAGKHGKGSNPGHRQSPEALRKKLAKKYFDRYGKYWPAA